MKKLITITLTLFLVPMLFGDRATDALNRSSQPGVPMKQSPFRPKFFHPPITGDRSQLLFDQAATGYNSFYACQWDSATPFDAEIADNFTVPFTALVDSLVWWGGYWGGAPIPPLDFWIKIYPDSTGFNQPRQLPIYVERVSYTEILISAPDYYYYYTAIIPPFLANSGETYWIEFQPTLILFPQWGNNGSWPANSPGWGDGQEAYFKSNYFGFPQWVPWSSVIGDPIETSFEIYGNPAVDDTVTWDFETGLQGWTHTNGLAFPSGWDVEPAMLHSNASSPNPGDSSMWIDSDEAGSGVTINDTAWSPILVPTVNTHWFKWGCGYQNLAGIDTFSVGIRARISGVWQVPVRLRVYSTDIGPDIWDSVDVSSYQTAELIQVFFAYNFANYAWYASFDNVTLNGMIYAPEHDVGTISIDIPAIVPENTTLNPQATVKNFGSNPETFDVTCIINPGGYISTKTVTDLDTNATAQITFTPEFSFVSGVYDVTVYTQLAGDANLTNDTLYKQVEATNWLYYDNGVADNAWAWYDPDNGWGVQFPVGMDWWVDSLAVHFWDDSWPSPGGNTATLRIYDGASSPTNIRQELTGITIVRGDWNKFALDTTLTHFTAGDNVYPFYIQAVAYPDCPGLSIDDAVNQPNYMWELFDGAFTIADNGGDWLIRIHILTETGISEWVSIPPDALIFKAPTIITGAAKVEFTLPAETDINLVVYDASGRLIQTLLSSKFSAGTHTVPVNFALPAGVYFYNLKTKSGINITRKFLIVQ